MSTCSTCLYQSIDTLNKIIGQQITEIRRLQTDPPPGGSSPPGGSTGGPKLCYWFDYEWVFQDLSSDIPHLLLTFRVTIIAPLTLSTTPGQNSQRLKNPGSNERLPNRSRLRQRTSDWFARNAVMQFALISLCHLEKWITWVEWNRSFHWRLFCRTFFLFSLVGRKGLLMASLCICRLRCPISDGLSIPAVREQTAMTMAAQTREERDPHATRTLPFLTSWGGWDGDRAKKRDKFECWRIFYVCGGPLVLVAPIPPRHQMRAKKGEEKTANLEPCWEMSKRGASTTFLERNRRVKKGLMGKILWKRI